MRNATRELTGYVDVLTRRQLCATTRRRCKPVHFCVPFTVEEVRERGVGKRDRGEKGERGRDHSLSQDVAGVVDSAHPRRALSK
jgi:hypothetical protein